MKILRWMILFIILTCLFNIYQMLNTDSLAEKWNITIPKQMTYLYQQFPEPSFFNDGITYKVLDTNNKNLSVSFRNYKNKDIEDEFLEYSNEAQIPFSYLPNFNESYQYYKKTDDYPLDTLIIVLQNEKLYIVSSLY